MFRIVTLILLLFLFGAADASQVRIAAAANFVPTLEILAEHYQREHGDRLLISSGSTGKHYAQIRQGAPFDVFLAADAERPLALEQAGLTVEDSRFVYAYGRLALWSPRLTDPRAALEQGGYRFLAVGNPRVVPYGAAAVQVLEALELATRRGGGRLVRGENIAQAYHFVHSGAAELGFVALSQITDPGTGEVREHHWLPPQELYEPVAQAAVQLAGAAEPAAAARFLAWLREDEHARQLIRASGYSLPE